MLKFIVTPIFIFIYATLLSQNYVNNEVLIQIKPTVTVEEFVNKINQNAPNLNLTYKKTLAKSLNIVQFTFNHQQYLVYEAIGEARELGDVLAAQPNHTLVSLRDSVPNDSQYDEQYAHQLMQSEFAWAQQTGGVTALGDTIVVAVIDGGFFLNHIDLNFFKNKHEIPNNNIDDDNNGYIDDVSGWDAYDSDGSVPNDFHGTHVAGIIGARGNNNIGVAGVNWNVQILPIAGSSGQESVVIEAYAYALDMRKLYNKTNGQKGAYVVATNSSFGINRGDPADFPIWCNFYDSLGYYGIISAGATANANFNIDQTLDIPTACPSPFLLSVTNTNNVDAKNGGAAYGKTTIDLGAPGTDIYSTGLNNSYRNATGTSMATPQVAGAVALMYAHICPLIWQEFAGNDSGLAKLIINKMLVNGVDTVNSLKNITVSEGRLNINKCLKALDDYCRIVSIKKQVFEPKVVSIFPNPTTNYLQILAPNFNGHLTVLNIQGKQLIEGYVNISSNHVIDISFLSSGIYFLKLTDNNGQIIVKKWLKD